MIKNLKKLNRIELIKIIRQLEKHIKLKCWDCMGGSKKVDCEMDKCPLFESRPWNRP